MSVRIYQLSKEIGMDNSELIKLLRDRGYEVKSASSTIDNISADSLREEFQKPEAEAPKEEVTPEKAKDTTPKEPKKPDGVVVRTREDIERERKEREEDAKKMQRPIAAPTPAPAPKAPPTLGKTPGAVVLPKTVKGQSGAAISGGTRGGAPTRVQPPKVSAPAATSAPKTPPVAKAPEVKKTAPAGIRPPAVKAPPVASAPKTPPVTRAVAPAPKAPQIPGVKPTGAAPATPKPAPVSPRQMAPGRTSAPSKPLSSAPSIPGSQTPPPVVAEEVAEEVAVDENLEKLSIKAPIVVRDFAILIGKKPFQLISELMEMNIFASMNQVIGEEIAVAVAKKNGFALEVKHRGEQQQKQNNNKKKKQAKEEDVEVIKEPRPPVICVLGHVDHGKTTLLDSIRNANVVSGEAGGITQHTACYQIEHSGQKITFIDTPGHAAFSNMRARGTSVTDIGILVVAADDGFMPQTDEALEHAQKAGIPVVVAINKMDAPGANPDKVKRQMQERNIAPEEWGGETLLAEISAIKNEGISDLLDTILLQAEVTEDITADFKGSAEGVILESQKEVGRGSTAVAIITKGKLKKGDTILCGTSYCKIRQLLDDNGKAISSAGPSDPVKVVGWNGHPGSGENFVLCKNERTAKSEAESALHELKLAQAREDSGSSGPKSAAEFLDFITRQKVMTYKVIVKADVYGTAEALSYSLQQIKSDKINLEVIDMNVGAITKNDVVMADAGGAAIVGFNVGMENGVVALTKNKAVNLISHNIIYELIDQVKDAMADKLEPEKRENKLGVAEVRAVFPVAKGAVAGCMVTEGLIRRNAKARLIRKEKVIADAKINTLRRFKDDATEVRAGYECGIQILDENGYEEGDSIECYEIVNIKADL